MIIVCIEPAQRMAVNNVQMHPCSITLPQCRHTTGGISPYPRISQYRQTIGDISPYPRIFQQAYGVDDASLARRVGGAAGNDGRVFERACDGVGERGGCQQQAKENRQR